VAAVEVEEDTAAAVVAGTLSPAAAVVDTAAVGMVVASAEADTVAALAEADEVAALATVDTATSSVDRPITAMATSRAIPIRLIAVTPLTMIAAIERALVRVENECGPSDASVAFVSSGPIYMTDPREMW
jgi:hypothetical protein